MRILALVALLVWACAPAARDAPAPPGTNVVLISIDTLRADHLGCYGYERPTSPAVDDFAAEAVVFENAMAHAPSTLHSHASILSSLLPHHHSASWAARTPMAEEVESLPEVLAATGVSTVAFTGGGQMDRTFGLDQGFALYQQPGVERFLETVQHAVAWLDERDSIAPFFLFLHSYEPHHPYTAEPRFLELFDDGYAGELPAVVTVDLLRAINRGEREIDARDLAHIVAAYDAEIRSVDEGFAHLVASLRQRGLYDDALIILTSDHGEEFNEHGRIGWHSHTLYDELLRVPLIVKLPGGRSGGVRVAAQARGIDVAPTILAALGIDAPAAFLGADLISGIGAGEPAPERLTVSRLDRPSKRDIESGRSQSWKLYRGQLFDLVQDPGEAWDVALNHPQIVRELELAMKSVVESRPRLRSEQVTPTGATLEELKALGYLE